MRWFVTPNDGELQRYIHRENVSIAHAEHKCSGGILAGAAVCRREQANNLSRDNRGNPGVGVYGFHAGVAIVRIKQPFATAGRRQCRILRPPFAQKSSPESGPTGLREGGLWRLGPSPPATVSLHKPPFTKKSLRSLRSCDLLPSPISRWRHQPPPLWYAVPSQLSFTPPHPI